jgi:putative flippase GtrA
MRSRMREGALLLGRFGLAGLVNTVVGFAVIVTLDPGLHAPPALANAAGYGAGIGVGFLLNRAFVFRSRTGLAASGARYVLAAFGAFILNQAVLRAAGLALGAAPLSHIAAQVTAMASYTAAFFVLCRLWVFRPLPVA